MDRRRSHAKLPESVQKQGEHKRNLDMASPCKRRRELDKHEQIPEQVEQALQERLSCFREKFGRDPSPNDPIFFDPHSDQPVPLPQEARNEMWNRLADAMVCLGEMTAEDAYAMKKTGHLVTGQTKHLLSDAQLDEWNDAVEEYRSTKAIKLHTATPDGVCKTKVRLLLKSLPS
jgi:hypothetical protein